MNQQAESVADDKTRWLHGWAWGVLVLVWPLVWVGSLVTTYDAGMSVPDWPNTYGDNLFLYPYETWLSGPFDLFIEHGHRLLGALVGVVAIVAVLVAWWSEPRRWVIGVAVAGLLLVIAQGVLGGMRVVLSDRVLAMTHGCTAPVVFAVFTTLAVVTSRWWQQEAGKYTDSDPDVANKLAARTVRMATATCGVLVLLTYGQMILGAQLRHVSMSASPGQFTHTVATHIVLAFVIWGLYGFLSLRMWGCGEKALSRPVMILLGLIGVQILLGLGTWVVNYGFPMFQDSGYAGRYLVHAKSFWGSFVVCGHVATGSLILAVTVMLWIRSWRLRYLQAA